MAEVCLVCLYAYPLFRPSVRGCFGGSEVRAWLFARSLARIGTHRVSFLVSDHGQPAAEQIDGVTVLPHRHYRLTPADGHSVGRFQTSPLGSVLAGARNRLARALGTVKIEGNPLLRARIHFLDRVNADVLCVFGVSNLAAEVAAHCRSTGRKMLLIAGSDEDFSVAYRPGSRATNPYGSSAGLCHFAVTCADAIVTQTDTQARLVRERFGRDAVTIRNPIDLESPALETDSGQRIALWIGKSDKIKQPELLVRLAAAIPSVRFLAIINRSDPAVFEQVRRVAPANLEIVEQLPFAEAERLFARAFVLINTSRFEGFPNTFLQAGKYSVPVLSLQVDPDRVISANECGIVARGDFGVLAQSLARLHEDAKLARQLGRNLRAYVERNHSLGDKARELDHLLTNLTEKNG